MTAALSSDDARRLLPELTASALAGRSVRSAVGRVLSGDEHLAPHPLDRAARRWEGAAVRRFAGINEPVWDEDFSDAVFKTLSVALGIRECCEVLESAT